MSSCCRNFERKLKGDEDYSSFEVMNSFPNFWMEAINSSIIVAVTTGELKTTLKNSPWSTPETESSGFGAKSVKKFPEVCSLRAINLVTLVSCSPLSFLSGVGL